MVKSAAGSDTQKSWKNTPEEMGTCYSTFAKGGVEMVWVEDVFDLCKHFTSDKKPPVGSPAMKQTVDAVHKAGGYIGYQIGAMSLTGITISSTFNVTGKTFANVMTKEQVQQYIADAADAAKNLKSAGFDAVEVNAAGNNIGQSFFSRNRNHRGDEYGPQSIENRSRFVCKIIQSIKAACGKDFPVQVLINGIEENGANLGNNSLYTTVEENAEICKKPEAAGANSLHVRLGPAGMHVCQFASDLYFSGNGIEGTTGYGNKFDFSRHWEGELIANRSGCGMMLYVAKQIKDAVSIPVGTVTYMARAHAPDYFEGALKDGKVDFLLMNRPLTVDPEYVNKLREGRIDEILPCTRCMHCHFDYDEDGNVYEHCRVNACTQRAYRESMPEGYEPLPKGSKKNIMVVGGRPRRHGNRPHAAQRGYKVTLYEKKGMLGGLLPFASAIKGPHENLDTLCKYLVHQLELKGVTVVTGTGVNQDLIKKRAPGAVILAAGGKRAASGLKGTSAASVVSIDDIATATIGDKVIIIGGNLQSIDTALYLIAQGKHVTVVSPDPIDSLDKGQSSWVRTFVPPVLYAHGTRVWPSAKISSVGNGEVVISGETGADATILCDTIIEAMDMQPNTALIDGLTGVETYAVGDCSEPWNIAEAIASGNMTARKI